MPRTHTTDPVDYSDYAEAVGRALREHQAERGILLCGSGVGASTRLETKLDGLLRSPPDGGQLPKK
jgi:ribose 5-phosphate isomerase RpiB